MVFLELRETLGSRVRGVKLEYQGPEERTVQRGRKVVLAPLVRMGHLEQ